MENVKRLVEGGGNTQIGGRYSERIDIRQIPFKEVQKTFGAFAKALNDTFSKKYGQPLWDDAALKSQKIYSGSSLHLMTSKKADILLQHKPTFGDVDLQINEMLKDEVTSFLKSLKGKIGAATYIGCKEIIDQVITIWEFTIAGTTISIQVDFEFVPFDGAFPNAWAQFSHSSSLDDIQAGIKGAFHKYLLRALTAKQLENGVLKKGRVGKEKFELQELKMWAFSVAKGLRKKYVETGETLNGTKVYTSNTTAKDQYTQDLAAILKILLHIENPKKKDFDDFASFLGCMRLIKRSNMSPNEVQNTTLAFVDLLWGKGSQLLYRDDPKKDFEEKMVAFKALEKEVGVDIPKVVLDKLITDFYQK